MYEIKHIVMKKWKIYIHINRREIILLFLEKLNSLSLLIIFKSLGTPYSSKVRVVTSSYLPFQSQESF